MQHRVLRAEPSHLPVPIHCERREHALPLVSIALGFATGSASDPAGAEGRLESAVRMLERGAGALGSTAIAERLDALGASLSLDVYRSFVTLEAQVLRRSLWPFVDLLETLLARPTFDEREVERLKRESVAELLEERDDDHTLVERAFARAFFDGHPYGALRSPRSILAPSAADLHDAYREGLTRRSLVLGFGGDLDPAEAAAIGERLAGALPASGAVRALAEPAPKRGRHLVFVDKPGRTQTQLLIGASGTSPRDEDHVPLIVAAAVMGGPSSSRLHREVRARRGLSYGAMARLGVDCIRQDFAMWTYPSSCHAATCIALELELLETFVRGGVTERELRFARRHLVASQAFGVDSTHKRMAQAVQASLLDLPAGYHADFGKRVRAVSLEATNAAVAARLSAEDLTLAIVGSFDDVGAEILASIPRLGSFAVVPFDATEAP